MTNEEFIEKVDYEGGVFDALMYGLGWDDLDDPHSDLAEAWKNAENAMQAFVGYIYAVQDEMEKLGW